MRTSFCLSLVLALSIAGQGAVIDVPRTPAPVIDGRVDPGEWANAASDRLSDGSAIRFEHDGQHLFIAIEGAGSGFPSLCVATDEKVRVLHASAALGSVAYAKTGSEWTSAETAFVYGMRNPALTDDARAERAAYLKQHGWLSTTVPMTEGRTQEMQISLDVTGRAPRLALGYLVIGRSDPPVIATWPASMSTGDGCAAVRLVTGYVPSPLTFRTENWATLRLR